VVRLSYTRASSMVSILLIPGLLLTGLDIIMNQIMCNTDDLPEGDVSNDGYDGLSPGQRESILIIVHHTVIVIRSAIGTEQSIFLLKILL
jgi:hypothetical protein